MDYRILAIALVSVLALSGCVQEQTPEAKAIALADSTPEAMFVQRMVDSISNIDKCTADQFISMAQVLDGGQASEVTPEMRAELEQSLQEAKEMAKKCPISVKKTASKQSENQYLVTYELETSDSSECLVPSEAVEVEVDLGAGTAQVKGSVGNSEEQIAMAEMLFSTMGDCAGLLFYPLLTGGNFS
jgi:coenzyme F420-reducing hydrogenase alpha subunit